MTKQRDDEFRVRAGKPRTRDQTTPGKYISRVIKATSQAGVVGRSIGSTTGNRRATQVRRGAAAIKLQARALAPDMRRVVIKTRLVNLKQVGARNTEKYLRYMQRDGVTRNGEPAVTYGPTDDQVDAKEFEARGREDRHQFRFIVSAEDATELGDLRAFTRDLMSHMERDCGTRLDWVAVDHWDTDSPHTHIVLRGKDQNGRDLILAREYISEGMRRRASEIATEWLGPRTEREIRAALVREVDQERWTTIDRMLKREAHDNIIELPALPLSTEARMQRSLKLGRLQRLQHMGLADKVNMDVWQLSPQAEPTLRAMGERGDIIRTMQRALKNRQQAISIHGPQTSTDVIGRVVGKGPSDELQERSYLIVDALDGRAHYVALPPSADITAYADGAVVRVRAQSTADRTIASVSEQCIYRTARHLALARDDRTTGVDPEEMVKAHVRRLEALRRAGIVERIEEGLWRIPPNLTERGRAYDAKRVGGASVNVLSHLPLERQVTAIGATWLDRQLLYDTAPTSEAGFSGDLRAALRQRLAFLVESGFAERRDGRVVLNGSLLAKLRERDLSSAAKQIADDSGLVYRPTQIGQKVCGIYRRSIMLSGGRFAMLDDGVGFSLVPWRAVMDNYIGRELRGVFQGGSISLDLARARGREI